MFISTLDKSAITLSTLCLVHCLALPILTIFLPNMLATTLSQEYFHILMIICVIPISIFSLTLGCKKHKKFSIGVYGSLGLILLILAVFSGQYGLNEFGEKLLTTIGAIMIAFAHFNNYRLCKKPNNCPC